MGRSYLNVPYTPSPTSTLSLRDYSLGLNTKDNPTAIDDRQLAEGSENFIIDERGAARQRQGYEIVGSPFGSTPIHSLYQFVDGEVSKRWLAGFEDEIRMLSGSSWATSLASGLSGDPLDFVTFKGATGAALHSGTATSAALNTLTQTGAGWTVNAYQLKLVKITGGTGAGQAKLIDTNTADTLTLVETWDTTPDATSTFEIYALAKCAWGANGVDNVQKWDGVTASFTDMGSAIRKFKRLEVYKEHLFGIDPSEPNTIRWSDIGHGEYFSASGYLTIETNDGDSMQEIKASRNYLYVLFRNSTYVIIGDSPAEFRPVRIGDVGTRAPESVQVGGANANLVFFLGGNNKVYVVAGATEPLCISDNVENLLDEGNTDLYDGCCGAIYDQRYYLFHPFSAADSTYNDRSFTFDLRSGRSFAPTVYRDVPFASAHVGLDDGNNPIFYVGDARSAADESGVYRFEHGYNDNGAAIFWRVRTKRHDMQTIARRKRVRYLFCFVRGEVEESTIQVFASADDRGFEFAGQINLQKGGFILGSSRLGIDRFGGSDTKVQRFRLPTRLGRLIQLEFTHTGIDQPVSFYGLELVYTYKKAR